MDLLAIGDFGDGGGGNGEEVFVCADEADLGGLDGEADGGAGLEILEGAAVGRDLIGVVVRGEAAGGKEQAEKNGEGALQGLP